MNVTRGDVSFRFYRLYTATQKSGARDFIISPVLFSYPVCVIITTRRIAVRMRNACINQGDIRTSACFTCCTNRDALHSRRKGGIWCYACSRDGGAAVYGRRSEVRKPWFLLVGIIQPMSDLDGDTRSVQLEFVRYCSPLAKMTDDNDQRIHRVRTIKTILFLSFSEFARERRTIDIESRILRIEEYRL